MEKNKKILSPKIDVVFKMIFGEQKNENITKKLIEDIFKTAKKRRKLQKNKQMYKYNIFRL